MSEITIVTAFFDIGRKNMEGFKRDNQTYFDYFRSISSRFCAHQVPL